MNRIIVLEGADGVGKSTLADEIVKQTKAAVIHATYNKDWDMETYHEDIIEAATILSEYTDVVLDRWAPSEAVYGKVFRGGESYDTGGLINDHPDLVFVYCHNDNAVQNHYKHVGDREEMFGDMSEVVKEFDQYFKNSGLKYLDYDYDKVNREEFVRVNFH